MKKNKYTLIISLLFFSRLGLAQDTLRLSLEQCLQLTMQNSERIRIAQTYEEQAEKKIKEARSALFPKISAQATAINQNLHIQEELYLPTQVIDPLSGQLVPDLVINPATGQPLTDAEGNPLFNSYAYFPLDVKLNGLLMADVSAQQVLYAGGKIRAASHMAALGAEIRTQYLKMETAQAIFETETSYYKCLNLSDQVKLAGKYRRLLEELKYNVNNGYEAGMVTRNDVLKVEVQLNEAILAEQKAKNGLKLAFKALNSKCGLDLDTPVQLNDSLMGFTVPNAMDNKPQSKDRLEYDVLTKQIELSKENKKLVRGDYLPSAGVSLGYNYTLVSLDKMNDYDSDGLNLMASIKIPLTTFGEKRAKLGAIEDEIKVKELELQQNTMLLQLEIDQVLMNLENALIRLQFSQTTIEQANENLKISNDHYELGMETLSGLLEAQLQWQKAQNEFINAKTEVLINQANLKRIVNKNN